MMDFTIKSGQLVRVSFSNTVYMTGVCYANRRTRNDSVNKVFYQYDVTGLKSLLTKRNIHANFGPSTSYTSIVADSRVMLPDLGLTAGYISSSVTTQEAIVTDGQTISSFLDSLASVDGGQWWIDNDFQLNFAENPADYSDSGNIVKAPWCLDPDNIVSDAEVTPISDYRRVEISEDYTNYANHINVIGAEYAGKTIKCWQYNKDDFNEFTNVCGYGAGSVFVHSDTNAVLNPDVRITDTGTNTTYIYDIWATGTTPTVVRSGDILYNKTRQQYTFITTVSVLSSTNTAFYVYPAVTGQTVGDYIHYNNDLNKLSTKLMKTKCAYPPMVINFDTLTPGFLPRQRLFVNLADLDCTAYFNINSVTVRDLSAGIFQFSVSAEKKDYDEYYSTITHRSYTNWFKKF